MMRSNANYDPSHDARRARDNYAYTDQNTNGVITKKTRNGSYNVIEKDFGDHKRIYHVPVEYGDDYDLSQLDEPTIVGGPKHAPAPVASTSNASSRLVRRRIYQEYDDNDYDDDDDGQEFVEEVPMVSSRRVYLSPRRNNRETEVIERVYETMPPSRKVEYIYEDDHSNIYEYRPEKEEKIEYVVRETAPTTIYIEEPQPTRRVVYVDEPPLSQPSPRNIRAPSPPLPPPVRHSPPNNNVQRHISPPPAPMKSNRFNEMSPPPSHRRAEPVRSPALHDGMQRNESAPLRLMDVVAQNRARRGNRLPRPRREVDEAKVYDPPTYNRNIIKNGFIVHK